MKIVDKKSFTKAAEELFINQSTMSKAVKNLEEELSTSLIDRTTHSFSITEDGELLYDFGKDVFSYVKRKEEELVSIIKNNHNLLRLGIPPTAGSIYFYSLISKYKEKYPEISIEIDDSTSKYVPENILQGSIDIGVVIEPFSDDRFIQKKVFKSEASLIVSKKHRLANKRVVNFFDLKDEKFLQVSHDFMYYHIFLDYCKKAGFEPDIVFESNQWDMILEMVILNKGIAILPKPLIDNYLKKRAHSIHLVNPTFPWSLIVIYDKDAIVTTQMQSFLDLCETQN